MKCTICETEYEGRVDSKTCSPKCRKKLSRGGEEKEVMGKTSEKTIEGKCHGCGEDCHKLICICLKCVQKGVTHESLELEMCVLDVSEIDRQELESAIVCYSHDEWVKSPEFEELMRRLNTLSLEDLVKGGYNVPARIWHKFHKNKNE